MICKDRVVIVTGAGRGLGRAHALAFAAAGARVVVNDIGATLAGAGTDEDPAADVAGEIEAMGGEAMVSHHDVADWEASGALVAAVLERWGRLDVIVNNAGVLRDRMFMKASPEEWDAVMHVHLRGHFCIARHAAAHWRAAVKAGKPVSGRIINTSSGAGLQGSIGQAAYSTAKAGIAALTLVQAAELGRYGVTANAIAPVARTRMTEAVFADMMKRPDGGFDAMAAENVSPLVVWLGSEEAGHVSGRVFEVAGGRIVVSDGWRPGAEVDAGRRWSPEELGPVVTGLVEEAPKPMPVYGAG